MSRELSMILEQLGGGLIVSCQALPDEPLHGAHIMARMAVAARDGGAVGIRANHPEDIRAIRAAVSLPLIGLWKDGSSGVYITPTFMHARAVAEAGADIVALDATQRPRPGGETLGAIIDAIHRELNRLVMADISTLDEGLAAEALGADILSTTLSGYTEGSPHASGPDLDLVRALVARARVPVVAEGRIGTPAAARAALEAGAFAVVVGGAITRPQLITRTFSEALNSEAGEEHR